MSKQFSSAGFHPVRRDRLLQEAVHDTYQIKGKVAEPTLCPDCGAVFQSGRWQWLEKPKQAHQTRCPACNRIRDRFPAGFVALAGDFFAAHQDEILGTVRNLEAREKAEHPLQRVMDIEKGAHSWMVTTTDIHLARAIGDALHHAYHGELEFHYNPQENLLRVSWRR